MTFRAASTGRLPAIMRPTIAAGDALIREVLAGKWPREPVTIAEAAPAINWREVKSASSPDREGSNKPLPDAGDPPSRPGQAPPSTIGPGGTDQVSEEELELPAHLKRDQTNRAPWMIPPPAKKARRAGTR